MKPFKILFVDDEEINLLNFRMIFQGRYDIITAHSGEEGLRCFRKNDDIGLIISDQRMPGLSGTEMLSRIYEINPDPIRVILTAYNQVNYVLDAINRGRIYQYILKPWETRDLTLVIERSRDLYLLKKENSSLTNELAKKNRNLEMMNQKLVIVNQALQTDVQRRKKLERSLRESEEKLLKFTQASQDMTILVDSEGLGVYSNPATKNLLGYGTNDDFMRFSLTAALHPDDQWIIKAEVSRLLHDSNPAPAKEVRMLKKDGRYLDVEMNFFCIDLEIGERLLGSIVRDITERKIAERSLRLSEERLGDLSAMLITAQDDERRRIAMELHDEFGQSLAALKLQLRALENNLHSNQENQKEKTVEGLQELRQYVNVQIENVRHLSRELWPMVVDDLGVDAAFENLFSGFLEYSGIEIDLDMEQVGAYFSVEEQRHLYRLLQESLNNVVKHAAAERIQVCARFIENSLVFAVHDNGCGFDVEAVSNFTGKTRGMGLQAMAERIKILNGQMEINSSPGKGTSIVFTLATDRNQ
ncbi:MAG: response regulator [Proteobacteria bacterium]|nr:response regulator [Pseudomonadota bacterium]MBU1059358.1 response regulator [Pseudomonadota bacterium]